MNRPHPPGDLSGDPGTEGQPYGKLLYRFPHGQGIDKVLKKVGEEAAELVIAGKGGERQEIVYETADLIFHMLVLLGFYDIEPAEVYGELRRRFGVSGIEEKSSRDKGK